MSLVGHDIGTLGSDRGSSSFANAAGRAKAVLYGSKHHCARVRAYVDNADCIARFYAAKQEKQPGNACAECSTVRLLVKKCAVKEVSNGK